MSNFIIERMTRVDVAQVEAIEQEIFSVPWSEKSFIDACETKENVYIVCKDNGKVLGYCGMWTVLGEGNITNMAVAKEYRRQGIAKLLMSEMERISIEENGVDVFFLEVRQSNENAKKLYEKMGYKPIGTRKRFYEKPVEDAIVMSKMTVTK
jgi:ribosomal-protein-alanine N-acetyltransferase